MFLKASVSFDIELATLEKSMLFNTKLLFVGDNNKLPGVLI
jgi:hypothetical protein